MPPLPNLDRRIRQGDALIDPLDIGMAYAGRPLSTAAPPELRPLLSRLEPASREYMSSGPDTRPALRRSLASLESRLARAWLDTLARQIDHDVRELQARSGDVDLFGAPTASAGAARARLPALTARQSEMQAFRSDLYGARALPFFSFRVHFAGTDGFDVLFSNPPWVRAHNWPPTVRQLLRERYRVCAEAGWPHAASATATPAGAGAQVDLAFLFLERSLRLLQAGGTLGMVLPAKLIRSLAPGGARSLLLSETDIASIEDHSLNQRAIFDADAFTAVLVAQRKARTDDGADDGAGDLRPSDHRSAGPPAIRVRMTRGAADDLRFTIAATDLPLRPGDARSPWLLAPPDCAATFRAMQG
ncbi:MAG: Eco57I restriction-modification methylase domain-containing protein, partial [Longimicrobiales bacterium]